MKIAPECSICLRRCSMPHKHATKVGWRPPTSQRNIARRRCDHDDIRCALQPLGGMPAAADLDGPGGPSARFLCPACGRQRDRSARRHRWQHGMDGECDELRSAFRLRRFGSDRVGVIPVEPASVDDYRRLEDMCLPQGKGAICKLVGPVVFKFMWKGRKIMTPMAAGERATISVLGTRTTCRSEPRQ